MTMEELKTAFFNQTPVASGSITYKCVSALIYRRSKKALVVQAELLDKCGHSVTIITPDRISFIKEDGK